MECQLSCTDESNIVTGTLTCGHKFCPDCIGKWCLQCTSNGIYPTCPLCRAEINIDHFSSTLPPTVRNKWHQTERQIDTILLKKICHAISHYENEQFTKTLWKSFKRMFAFLLDKKELFKENDPDKKYINIINNMLNSYDKNDKDVSNYIARFIKI